MKIKNWMKKNKYLLILVSFIGLIVVAPLFYPNFASFIQDRMEVGGVPETSYYSFSLISVDCYENYIKFIVINTGTYDINNSYFVLNVFDNESNFIGCDSNILYGVINTGEEELFISDNISLIKNKNYLIKVNVEDNKQSLTCVAQSALNLTTGDI